MKTINHSRKMRKKPSALKLFIVIGKPDLNKESLSLTSVKINAHCWLPVKKKEIRLEISIFRQRVEVVVSSATTSQSIPSSGQVLVSIVFRKVD